jgi:FkbM family methyltransferase
MKRLIPKPLHRELVRWRERLSPTRRKARRELVRAEAARVDGVAALVALAGRGDVRELIVREGEAELVLHDGRRFRYNPGDRLERLYSLPITGEFERKETEWVRRWLKPGMHCVDAGGSFGWYAVLMSQAVGNAGGVRVFEPIPRTAGVLEANLKRNACSNAVVHRVALAEADGHMDLYVPDIGVSGSLRLHDYDDAYEVFSCPVRALDSMADEGKWPKIDFIKADIEGAEFALLRGAERVIRRDRPLMMLEAQASSTRLFGYEPSALFAWLEGVGYGAAWVSMAGELVACTGREDTLPDYNFIFFPEELGSSLMPGRGLAMAVPRLLVKI